ncbi:exo 1,3/1,4-beta-D-glucan glucohydrolase [Novosphingobium sp. Chol11]|uniref:glycoside hydrolase family 3 protein n=1 Tax=Novosphingobium sp. Chol11 TaxID=1385763 RepID=UPI0025D2FEDB|nr:exo 1,3/1,4-beta-D-glucan glucohydrolase [Novosphingobium sp. Chol11]
MTIEQKVGQIIQADIASIAPGDVRRYHLGSVLNGGNSAPGGDEFASPDKWLALADALYLESVDLRDGNAGIPIIWGTDAVHGHSNIVGATLFPHNIGLGAAHDPALIERIGRATALEVRATGLDWTFAPTITVPQDYRWGRAYEGYSSDPALVTAYAQRMIAGLQGISGKTRILSGPHVLASTKHFIADGATDEGADQGNASIDETTLRKVHGAPYLAAIDAGVATIMASFSSWQGTKIAGNKGLLTDVLKRRMGFGGFVVTDWNAHGQIKGCTNDSCPAAINAGVDMYMAPDSWKPLYHSLVAQVRSGIVPLARLDDAVARILRAKLRLGLFEAGTPSSRPFSGRFDLLGSAAHREIAREAVRKSLVLLKANGGVLPIRPGAKVLVAGDGADDIGRQSGGWTITWQGTGVANKDFPGGTSIWRGLEAAVRATGGQAELAPDGQFNQRPDVAIVVFGEMPYAELQGDLKTLQLRLELRAPYATMQRLKAQGIPVVAVMITGRPLFVNPELNLADAFVVAWLPGSEGQGVADMLVQGGTRPRYDFSGTLPTAWPATARHEGPALFKRGFGRTMAQPGAGWQRLNEDPGVVEGDKPGVFLDKGAPTPSWSLVVSDGGADATRVTMLPAIVLGGRGQVAATDHLVQEGARQFTFTGDGRETVELVTQAPIDISRETNGDVMLLVTARIDAAPATGFTIAVGCGPSCSGAVAVPQFAANAIGQWQTIGVPLKCFAQAGADMTRLAAPFQLSTAGAARFSLARVALGTVADQVAECPH